MSLAEKLQAMESLWDSITRHNDEYISPAWHEGILKETQSRFAGGREQALDWDAAKKELQRRSE